MQVRELLNRRLDHIITVSPAPSFTDAAIAMAEHRIGAAVVTDENQQLVGVISERDIVYAVASSAGKLKKLAVQNLMTTSVVTCDLTDNVLVAIRKMYDHTIRHIVVLNGGELAGVLSLRDILNAMFIKIEEHEQAGRGNPVGQPRSA